MVHTPHRPAHWLLVALVLALALIAVESAAHAQSTPPSTNAQAVFQGRPYMGGAQAGLGAEAGPAQGGIGLQGSDGAGLNLRKPSTVEKDMAALPPPVACPLVPRISSAEQPLCLSQVYDERLERRYALLGIDPQQRRRM
jgi:hypothetical protein